MDSDIWLKEILQVNKIQLVKFYYNRSTCCTTTDFSEPYRRAPVPGPIGKYFRPAGHFYHDRATARAPAGARPHGTRIARVRRILDVA
jgi:hypothetical protein